MKGFILLGILTFVVALATSAAATDDYDEEMLAKRLEYLQDLNELMGPASRMEKSKRGQFCLSRDMTCPSRTDGRDFCCTGSQCACNIFGQNCRCSSLGLFQRLGRR